MTGTTLLMGIAVALALEGLVYAVAPPERLRIGGLAAAAIGIALAWVLKSA